MSDLAAALERLDYAARTYERARNEVTSWGKEITAARAQVGRLLALAVDIQEGDILADLDGRWEVVGFTSSPVVREEAARYGYVIAHPLLKSGLRRKEGARAIRRTMNLASLVESIEAGEVEIERRGRS